MIICGIENCWVKFSCICLFKFFLLFECFGFFINKCSEENVL